MIDDLLGSAVRSPLCTLCPRECRARRNDGETGICGVDSRLMVARAALHMWEEPCISGSAGSGTVFFSGCHLGCVYCQNFDISRAETGKIITVDRLSDIFLELERQGALNINLVTPSHYIPQIARAILISRDRGLRLPIVYNGGGYDKAESIKLLDGLIDIYMPDFKYYGSDLSARYSAAPDYFKYASESLREMVRQIYRDGVERSQGDRCTEKESAGCVFYDEKTGLPLESMDDSEHAVMRRGVIVRHLLLPGGIVDSKRVVRYLYETYGDRIYLSLMNQYTPMARIADKIDDGGNRRGGPRPDAAQFPELDRTVTQEEYDSLVDYAIGLGVTNGFIQEGETAEESFIPPFDCSGV